jgi:hypothetical protein
MHAHRRDQQHGGADRARDGDQLDRVHNAVGLSEPLLERQRQQEAGEQLDAGFAQPAAPATAGPITVQPLRFRFVAVPISHFWWASGCSMSSTGQF